MSKMKDLLIQIQEMLADNVAPALIACRLDVPIAWVIEAEEQMLYDDSGYDYTEEEQYNLGH